MNYWLETNLKCRNLPFPQAGQACYIIYSSETTMSAFDGEPNKIIEIAKQKTYIKCP